MSTCCMTIDHHCTVVVCVCVCEGWEGSFGLYELFEPSFVFAFSQRFASDSSIPPPRSCNLLSVFCNSSLLPVHLQEEEEGGRPFPYQSLAVALLHSLASMHKDMETDMLVCLI